MLPTIAEVVFVNEPLVKLPPAGHAISLASSPENRCSVLLFLTPVPSARFWPIRTNGHHR
jgi:hypothetical protein